MKSVNHSDIGNLYARHPADGVTSDQILDLYKSVVVEDAAEAEKAAFVAAQFADVAALRILFDGGVSPSVIDSLGFTLLHRIAKESDMKYYRAHADAFKETIELLLDNRVGVLKKDGNEGLCCYHYAARRANWHFVQVLRERGVKLDMIGKNGVTALHELVEYFYVNRYSTYAPKNDDDEKEVRDFISTAEEFIAAGLDLGARDDYGNTVGDLVISKKAAKLFGLLVPDKNVFQAIYLRTYDEIPGLVVGNLNAVCETNTHGLRDFKGLTPLGMACREIDDVAVSILLDAGADANYVSDAGSVALIELFRADNLNETVVKEDRINKILGMFVAHNWDKNGIVDSEGNTLLNFICKSDFCARGNKGQSVGGQIIDYLIAKGAEVNAANHSGQTPLMFACKGEYEKMESVQIALLEAGADVTARDSFARTPLHYAAMGDRDNGAKAMVDMLFSFGKPDVLAADNNGKTALDIATEQGNEETVKYLLGKIEHET